MNILKYRLGKILYQGKNTIRFSLLSLVKEEEEVDFQLCLNLERSRRLLSMVH